MSSLKPPSIVEKIAGSLPVEGALTAITAAAGTPLSALLPVLGNSLAAERQKHYLIGKLNPPRNSAKTGAKPE